MPESSSGAAYRGVPSARVAWVGLCSRAIPKSTSTIPSSSSEDQVGGLDIAVDDLLLVHVGERLARLADVLDRLGHRQRAAALEHSGEARAAHQIHHEVVALAVGEVVDHAHHTRVAQTLEQPRLDLEAHRVGVLERLLDRHLEAVFEPARAVHGAHAADRDRGLDHVPANPRARVERSHGHIVARSQVSD